METLYHLFIFCYIDFKSVFESYFQKLFIDCKNVSLLYTKIYLLSLGGEAPYRPSSCSTLDISSNDLPIICCTSIKIRNWII